MRKWRSSSRSLLVTTSSCLIQMPRRNFLKRSRPTSMLCTRSRRERMSLVNMMCACSKCRSFSSQTLKSDASKWMCTIARSSWTFPTRSTRRRGSTSETYMIAIGRRLTSTKERPNSCQSTRSWRTFTTCKASSAMAWHHSRQRSLRSLATAACSLRIGTSQTTRHLTRLCPTGSIEDRHLKWQPLSTGQLMKP